MTTVRQLLDQKGKDLWSIHPDATVFDAVAKMAEKDIGSLVVMEGWHHHRKALCAERCSQG